MNMPGLDGIEVAMRVEGTDMVVVLLTAFSQRALIESARDAGVVAYLVKPFRSSEILPKLAAILLPGDPDRDAEASHVEDKIETREIVQRAKEMLMEERGLDEPAAFEIIQQSAMRGREAHARHRPADPDGEFVG